MSHIWTFSPSSEELLQKCIAAAPPPDMTNKWMLAFRRKPQEIEPKHNLNCSSPETIAAISCDLEVKNDFVNDYAELIDIIETDPASRWDYLVEECMKTEKLFILLAERLSTPSIERLCKQILVKQNVDLTFIEYFCKFFIPKCIKREYNRFYLDFFVGIYGLYPRLYDTLLKVLLQDIGIPSKMLSEFITLFNENQQNEFLNNILCIKLSAEMFIHHLPTILTMYQINKTTDEITSYIFSNLVQFNAICSDNKHYGKLFLAYLKNEKAKNKDLNVQYLRDLLDSHKTPFRKPCEKILNDMAE